MRLLRVGHHIGTHQPNHTTPITIGVVVVLLVVVAELHGVVRPLQATAFIGCGAQSEVITEPITGIAQAASAGASCAAG